MGDTCYGPSRMPGQGPMPAGDFLKQGKVGTGVTRVAAHTVLPSPSSLAHCSSAMANAQCPLAPLQLAQKYDPQREQELRLWIEDMTGERLGDNFMEGLKDGVILCK